MSVAVVILNWNGKYFLEKFVPTLLYETRVTQQKSALGSKSSIKGSASIFIADNGSTDGSVEWIEWAYPSQEVNLIKFDHNYGFTGGYNKAFEEIYSSGGRFKYYLLLNSDVEVTSGWLSTLEHFMNQNPKTAICSPKILSYNNKDYFEHAGACGGLMDRYFFPYCYGRILSRTEKDSGQYDNVNEVFWASGAAFMVRSSVWRNLGGLDEKFFAHMEEIDMCWRAQLLGWKVCVVPKSVVYHVGGGALPNNSPKKLYLNFRNNLLTMYKNLPKSSRGRIIFFRMCIDGIIACIYLITGKFQFFLAVTKAHQDYRKIKRDVVISQQVVKVQRPKKTLLSVLTLKNAN